MVNPELSKTAQYICLKSIEYGSKFYTMNCTDRDQRYLANGSLAYEVLGYANTDQEAQDILQITFQDIWDYVSEIIDKVREIDTV